MNIMDTFYYQLHNSIFSSLARKWQTQAWLFVLLSLMTLGIGLAQDEETDTKKSQLSIRYTNSDGEVQVFEREYDSQEFLPDDSLSFFLKGVMMQTSQLYKPYKDRDMNLHMFLSNMSYNQLTEILRHERPEDHEMDLQMLLSNSSSRRLQTQVIEREIEARQREVRELREELKALRMPSDKKKKVKGAKNKKKIKSKKKMARRRLHLERELALREREIRAKERDLRRKRHAEGWQWVERGLRNRKRITIEPLDGEKATEKKKKLFKLLNLSMSADKKVVSSLEYDISGSQLRLSIESMGSADPIVFLARQLSGIFEQKATVVTYEEGREKKYTHVFDTKSWPADVYLLQVTQGNTESFYRLVVN